MTKMPIIKIKEKEKIQIQGEVCSYAPTSLINDYTYLKTLRAFNFYNAYHEWNLAKGEFLFSLLEHEIRISRKFNEEYTAYLSISPLDFQHLGQFCLIDGIQRAHAAEIINEKHTLVAYLSKNDSNSPKERDDWGCLFYTNLNIIASLTGDDKHQPAITFFKDWIISLIQKQRGNYDLKFSMLYRDEICGNEKLYLNPDLSVTLQLPAWILSVETNVIAAAAADTAAVSLLKTCLATGSTEYLENDSALSSIPTVDTRVVCSHCGKTIRNLNGDEIFHYSGDPNFVACGTCYRDNVRQDVHDGETRPKSKMFYISLDGAPAAEDNMTSEIHLLDKAKEFRKCLIDFKKKILYLKSSDKEK